MILFQINSWHETEIGYSTKAYWVESRLNISTKAYTIYINRLLTMSHVFKSGSYRSSKLPTFFPLSCNARSFILNQRVTLV